VAGRAQAFSDPEVIRLASEQFIPVAENCSPLQRQRDAKGDFFRLIAEQGHYAGRTFPTDTRQGYYAFTADGTLLAARNSRDPRQMEEMLHTALRRWSVLADTDDADGSAPETLPDYAPARPSRYPEGGLILQLAARDLPRAVDTRKDDWRKSAWNLDYAWFSAEEARAIVPQPRLPGSRQQLPREVIRRLARFHLRDFVRGEPPVWPEEAIRDAELESAILEVAGDERRLVRLALHGAVRLEWDWRWHDRQRDEDRHAESGFDAALYGEATWDESRGAFIAFELLAAGPRWGTGQYNNRADDLGPAPLGIAFTLAGDEPRDRTPPHTIYHPDYFGR